MGGHLDEFWPDVGPNSGWRGGTGESWERGPYFLDGLVPLAWQLDDPTLKAKAMRFIDWTLDHQQPSGMIGPASNDDWWPRMVMVKVLTQYHEATADPRVIPALTRYFHYQLQTAPSRPLQEWGKYRWQDEVVAIQWLHDRTRDPKLLDLAALLQQQGFDWVSSFRDFRYTTPTPRAVIDRNTSSGNSEQGMQTHGVNNGMGLKTAAVQFRLTGNPAEKENYDHQLSMLDRYHGIPNGMFTCDEHLGGLDPSHGTELCTVVETLFSMEVALATFGDPRIADRIETIAYNALPGTFTDDMWAHQYDQQSNQIASSLNSKPWTTNGPESNLYGLEPHFGCCTANFHQGWPKLTSSLWMATPDGGLAATIYAPCDIHTTLDRQPIHIHVDTDYPFRETVRITVNPASPLTFPLHLRIPAWAAGSTLTINGKPHTADLHAGTSALLNRAWHPGDTVELRLPMRPTATRWFHDSIAYTRGPLVFSLDPGTTWVKLRDRPPTADWQVFPQNPWNYAVAPDAVPTATETPVGPRPFSAETPGVTLHLTARQLDTWRAEDNVADPIPQGPQHSQHPDVPLTLIPYAAAKLRITAFPTLAVT